VDHVKARWTHWRVRVRLWTLTDCRTVEAMRHRGLSDPDWKPGDPEPEGYTPQELEERLREWFGGDTWRTWDKGVAVPGAELYAGYTKTDTGRLVLSGLVLLGDALTADNIHKVPITALENSVNISHDTVRQEVDQLPPLTRTPELSPEDFSRLVAEHYRTWARSVPHPAAAMAADAGAKLPTVHTWIREARLRGFLPPAKRGKAK
jgi:hypothetical protein